MFSTLKILYSTNILSKNYNLFMIDSYNILNIFGRKKTHSKIRR